jgi:hypothetical protein
MSLGVNFSTLQSATSAAKTDAFLLRLDNALSGTSGFAQIELNKVETSLGVYSTVQSNSASWAVDSTTDSGVRALTANWQNTYSTVNSTSSRWSGVYTSFNAQSASNASVYSTVQSNSASWAVDSTTDVGVRSLTANWQNTYSTVQSNSAFWADTRSNTLFSQDVSANNLYLADSSNSVGNINFGQNVSKLAAPSANGANDKITLWDFRGTGTGYNYAIGAEGSHVWFTMDVVGTTGGFKFYSRNNQIFKVRSDGYLILNPGTDIIDTSNNSLLIGTKNKTDSVYSSVSSTSGNWSSVYSSFNSQSANNASVYSTVQSNSSTWSTGNDSAPTTLTYAATATPNFADGANRQITMTGDLTLNGPTGASNGSTWQVRLSAFGSTRTVTLGTNLLRPAGTTFVGAVSAGNIRLLQMIYNGTNWWVVRNQEFTA